MWIFRLPVLICAGSLVAMAAPVSGEAVYARRCAVCHEQVNEHIPARSVLQGMPATKILKALDFGAMMGIANPMNREERGAVSKYLGTNQPEVPLPATAFCSDRKVTVDDKSKFVWNGWSPGADNTRFQPAAVAGLTIDGVKNLKLKWAFGFDGDVTAFGAPSVLGNQVFVGSAGGTIQALHLDTGCIQWTYQADGPVRAAIQVEPMGSKHVLLFGTQIGWFYALEAETGKLLWRKKVEPHEAARLTGAAAVNDGIVYVPVAAWEETRSSNPDYVCCTFRGSLVALRIKDGSQVWKTWMMDEAKPSPAGGTPRSKMGPSGASIWSAPTLDLKRHLIYVTTGDNFSEPATLTSDALVAIEMGTGKIAWSKQVQADDVSPAGKGPDYDFGASAIMVKTPEGKDLLVAGQKSAMVYAFDPDRKGEIVWKVSVGKGGTQGGVQWGLASDGRSVYAAVSDKVYTTVKNADGTTTRSLNKAGGGGLTALRIADGSQAWYAEAKPCDAPGCSPAQSAALTAIPGVVFSGAYDGHLRAYSSENGSVLWDFNTLKDFPTVNGVKAKGGALDGAGPVIVNGMMLVNSGYPRFGGLPGNVLLAFSVQ